MKKEIPILFSTPMVQAILEGRKTQTRRLIKDSLQPVRDEVISGRRLVKPSGWPLMNADEYTERFCPYGKPGDILWVREKFCFGRIAVGELPDGRDSKPYVSQCTGEKDFIPYEYCLSDDIGIEDVTWKPSIHMRKEYARIWLKVESVRVERLQDISEEDAIAEGVKPAHCETNLGCPSLNCKEQCCEIGNYWNYRAPDGEGFPAFSARSSFESLWESINGADSWHANPFVWVVSFSVLSTTGKPDLQLINK